MSAPAPRATRHAVAWLLSAALAVVACTEPPGGAPSGTPSDAGTPPTDVAPAAPDASPAPPVETALRPDIRRLDTAVDRVLDGTDGGEPDDRLPRLTRLLQADAPVYARLGHGSVAAYAEILLSDHAITRDVTATRQLFGERDLDQEIAALYARTLDALGARPATPARFHVAYGWAAGTNAQTTRLAPDAAAPDVLLNLTALRTGRHFEAAAAHETVHTVQPPLAGATLLERALYEGRATYVSQRVVTDLSTADALFWSAETLQQASARRDALVAAFDALRDSTDPALVGGFLVLDRTPSAVPGAPDRCGYYLGYLAAAAWMDTSTDRTLRDLLHAPASDVWDALAASVRDRE